MKRYLLNSKQHLPKLQEVKEHHLRKVPHLANQVHPQLKVHL